MVEYGFLEGYIYSKDICHHSFGCCDDFCDADILYTGVKVVWDVEFGAFSSFLSVGTG